MAHWDHALCFAPVLHKYAEYIDDDSILDSKKPYIHKAQLFLIWGLEVSLGLLVNVT